VLKDVIQEMPEKHMSGQPVPSTNFIEPKGVVEN
jgi:hypothetical protein